MPGWSARVGEKLYLKLFLAYVSFTANSHPPPLEYPRKGMIPARPQIAEPSTYYRCNVFFAISHVSFTNASFLFFFFFLSYFFRTLRFCVIFLFAFSVKTKTIESFSQRGIKEKYIYRGINCQIYDNCFVTTRLLEIFYKRIIEND